MAAVTIFFVPLAALIFDLIGRFGDLPRLMGGTGGWEKSKFLILPDRLSSSPFRYMLVNTYQPEYTA
jgi:hypothetical protein